jgi:ComF family protein
VKWLGNNFTHNLTSRLVALALPPRCAGCNSLLTEPARWCPDCWRELAIAFGKPCCPSCASPIGPFQSLNPKNRCNRCLKPPHPVSAICRLGTYDGVLSDVICNLKYNRNIYSGELIADLLAEKLADQGWLGEIEGLCPVPMHWTRHLLRRLDHTRIIADRLSRHTHLPVLPALRRRRSTPPQVGLSALARRENIKDAFAIKKRWPLEGTTLCLVDDVMTTGATLFEAARTLKHAGAKTIYAAILARAEKL